MRARRLDERTAERDMLELLQEVSEGKIDAPGRCLIAEIMPSGIASRTKMPNKAKIAPMPMSLMSCRWRCASRRSRCGCSPLPPRPVGNDDAGAPGQGREAR